ncbi:hypothetical protein [Thalassoroseus pseudoceratinae]|uniref:hypothetical protein n=1 Tax=Thalassoroseus pseudoceratinae TaxID=2713176 RepID=UPI00141DB39B|nr:hypothetical protein [Thalassoroseus pseudoceratinae]
MRSWILSVMILAVFAGCSKKDDSEFSEPTGGSHVEDSAHAAHGPHDGHMAHMGAEHLVEVTVSKEPKQVAVYILDHDDQTVADVEPSAVVLFLTAHKEDEGEGFPLTKKTLGEGDDAETAWVIEGDAVPAELKSIEDFKGHVDVTLDEETTTVTFAHEHDDHDDHEGHEEHKE